MTFFCVCVCVFHITQLLQGVDGGEQTMPVLWISHIQISQVVLPQPHQVIHRLVTVQLQGRGVLLVKASGKTSIQKPEGTTSVSGTNKNTVPPN